MDYAFLALIISILVSRLIQLSAFRTLTDADKSKVLSKNIMQLSQISLIFSIILIGAFYFFISKYPDKSTQITSSFFIALVLQRIIVYVISRNRMIADGVPENYRTRYFLSWLVTTIGVCLFIILFMWQFNNGLK